MFYSFWIRRSIVLVWIFVLCVITAAQSPRTDQTYSPYPLPNQQRQNERISNTNLAPDDELIRRGKIQPEKYPQINNRALEAEEPEPNEFQRYVFSTTGQRLPLFGYSLFQEVPSTFSPVDRVPVTSDYVIGPGDEVLVRAWGQIDIDYRAVVDRLGNIFIPQIGNISVAGVKYGQLQPYVKSSIGRVFRNFDLNVTLGQLRSIQIFVVGQARRPGAYTVSSLSTLVNALFASGGPSTTGSMRNIQLKRGDKVVTEFDLYDLLLNGDKSKDVPLAPGDVIFIPPVGQVVAVIGSVHTPAVYEIEQHCTLGHLIGYSGGLSAIASGGKATLERISQRSIRTMDEFALDDAGLEREIRNGDLITIRSLSARFDNAITLRGNVANPGRYPWRQGVRITDIIPTQEALITRDYWRKQGELGKDPELASTSTKYPKSRLSSATARQNGDSINGDSIEEYELSSSNRRTASNSVQYPDVDNPNDPQTSDQLSLKGNKHQSLGEAKLTNQIKHTSPDINWDYAVIQRFNRKELNTKLLPFNLAKAISTPDAPDNLQLEPGDVITIFSQKDIKVPQAKVNKFVRLEGEFKAAGVYEVQPGETLKGLMARAGGLTDAAYLYGAEFTRESARERQQENLDNFLDRFEREVERASSQKSQNLLSVEEAAGLQSRVESQRKLVEKLRQVKATGRVVLGLTPWRSDIEALPDLVLEDGDTFVVPYRPATINVVGAVYNENSFIYSTDRRLSYYLGQAGGGTRDADKQHTFIVRADGSVVSKAKSSGWFLSSFDSMKLMPGDTIVLPEHLDKVSVLKGLKDWSQVISQFALGVAAIRSITRP